MTDLIDTTEMYLRTILELEEENIVPLRARISERLGHSGPTVSQTIGRMERDGLVVVSEDRSLELTLAGRQKAVDVMRKHRLAERLLSDVIGLDWAYVHEEACRWEHVMSEQVERRLVELLGHPTESPYGNPIPGLDQLGDVPATGFDQGVVGLVRAHLGHRPPPRGARSGRPRTAAAAQGRGRRSRRHRRLPLQRGLRTAADERQR
jgi:DtxR family Mn-dependent transcriptional regulator